MALLGAGLWTRWLPRALPIEIQVCILFCGWHVTLKRLVCPHHKLHPVFQRKQSHSLKWGTVVKRCFPLHWGIVLVALDGLVEAVLGFTVYASPVSWSREGGLFWALACVSKRAQLVQIVIWMSWQRRDGSSGFVPWMERQGGMGKKEKKVGGEGGSWREREEPVVPFRVWVLGGAVDLKCYCSLLLLALFFN